MSVNDELKDIQKRLNKIEPQIAKLPSRINSSVGGSGGSNPDQIWYTATTKAGLESDVPQTSLGRVTAGAELGMVCVRNPDNDGWDAINFFE